LRYAQNDVLAKPKIEGGTPAPNYNVEFGVRNAELRGGTPAPDYKAYIRAACGKCRGTPKSISEKTFWGRGETNETTLKDLLANSFCCEICLDEGEGRALPQLHSPLSTLQTLQNTVRFSELNRA